MKPILTAREHYDRLAERGDGRHDPPLLQSYMARWDGPLFYDMLGDLTSKDVLEVGVGVGRVAREVLRRGCRRLTGLDLSPKAVAAARKDLAEYANLELVVGDICQFSRPAAFDVAYSVLTLMHVEDKPAALRTIVASLKPGGHAVLSIEREREILDYGEWTVQLYPWPPERYAEELARLGCGVDSLAPLIDTWTAPDGTRPETYGEPVATLVKAVKR